MKKKTLKAVKPVPIPLNIPYKAGRIQHLSLSEAQKILRRATE
jgi:hypothetical protein